MSVLSIQTRRIDGLTEATTAEDEDLLLIRKADGTGTRNIKKKNLIPKIVDKVGDMKELITSDKTSVVKAINEVRKKVDYYASEASGRFSKDETAANYTRELVEYVVQDNAASHNNIYRGKNLGYSLTKAQLQGIKDGTFKDLYIGDYFLRGNDKLYVAHLDYFYRRAKHTFVNDVLLSTHHIVLIQDCTSTLMRYDAQGNDYFLSDLRKEAERRTIQSAGWNIPEIEELDVSCMQESSYYKCHTGALNSYMVMGRDLKTNIAYSDISSDSQMALFRLSPKEMCINNPWWLANSTGEAYAFMMNRYGAIEKREKTYSSGLRPYYIVTAR